jgi:hypothetical protein
MSENTEDHGQATATEGPTESKGSASIGVLPLVKPPYPLLPGYGMMLGCDGTDDGEPQSFAILFREVWIGLPFRNSLEVLHHWKEGEGWPLPVFITGQNSAMVWDENCSVCAITPSEHSLVFHAPILLHMPRRTAKEVIRAALDRIHQLTRGKEFNTTVGELSRAARREVAAVKADPVLAAKLMPRV